MEKEQQAYSEQWLVSANHFYENGSYRWMCKRIKHYKVVLEIGCGTGHSTLSLLENKHKVICIEKNKHCIDKAKNLIQGKGFKIAETESDYLDSDVIFLNYDVYNENLLTHLDKFSFNVVIAWCIGTYWNKEMEEFYATIWKTKGYTHEEVCSDKESAYAELIILKSCEISKKYKIPLHLIERQADRTIVIGKNPYYISLKKEFNFSSVKFKTFKTTSISATGVPLKNCDNLVNKKIIPIKLLSVIYK